MTISQQMFWSGLWTGLKLDAHAFGVAAEHNPLLFSIVGAVVVLGIIVRIFGGGARRRRAR